MVCGAQVSGTAGITPAPEAGRVVNDIDLLFVETANQAASLTATAGFTVITFSGVGVAAGADGTRMTVFWRRWDGAAGNPTVADSGDHQIAVICSWRGIITTGNPWDVFGTNSQTPTTTAGSVSAVTTTRPNRLIVIGTAGSLPDANTTAQFSGWTNANLTSLTERFDETRNPGNGGALGVADGVMASAGSTGTTTFTSVNSATKAHVKIALMPQPVVITVGTTGSQVANMNQLISMLAALLLLLEILAQPMSPKLLLLTPEQ